MKKLMTVLLTLLMSLCLCTAISADGEEPTFSVEEGEYDHNLSVTITWPVSEDPWYVYQIQIDDNMPTGGGDSSNVQTFTLSGETGKTITYILTAYKGGNSGGVSWSKTYKITLASISGEVDESAKSNIETTDNASLDTANVMSIELVLTNDPQVDDESKSKIEEVAGATVTKYLDLNLLAKDANGNVGNVKTLNEDALVTIHLDNETQEAVKGKNIKVIRLHDGEAKEVASVYNEATGVLTIKSNAFSTFAIVASDKAEEEDSSDPYANVKWTEANTPCEEWNHSKNWTWSESQQKCIYRVTNTSSK